MRVTSLLQQRLGGRRLSPHGACKPADSAVVDRCYHLLRDLELVA